MVLLVEFASYSGALLRELGKSAEKFGETRFVDLLNAAVEEAARIEEAARAYEN